MNSQSILLQNIRVNRPDPTYSLELINLIFFDIETTGLRPDRGAKITEVSILNRNSQIYSWQLGFKPGASSFSDELQNILIHLKQGVVVGHNLQFDFWFISYEAEKLGIDGPSLQFIDTLSLSRKVLPQRNSYILGNLLMEFDIKVNGELHNAITDTEATRALFWKLVEKGGISTVGEAGMKKLNWSSF